MRLLTRLLNWVKSLFAKETPLPPLAENSKTRYHCVRIFRKEGDEIVMLLTEEEMENGIRRAIEHIGVVPYSE
jgi:hypothetical protein